MTDIYREPDFTGTSGVPIDGRFLPETSIEVVSQTVATGGYRDVLFDFDGTLSLIREGWPEIMIPMMVEFLLETPDHESEQDLRRIVTEYVMRLTGKQTIYQMIQLAEEVAKRNGAPLDPLEYKREYNRRLMRRISERRESLRTGSAPAEQMLVPGTLELLESLVARGMRIYLASGTDEPFVKEEAELLGLTRYFGGNIHGALDNHQSFSKAMVIEKILTENAIRGANLLGFGDAYVEVVNVKSVGGTAIGVASDEAGRSGKPDPWKRARLIAVGADIVIPDFRECGVLLDYLFNERA